MLTKGCAYSNGKHAQLSILALVEKISVQKLG